MKGQSPSQVSNVGTTLGNLPYTLHLEYYDILSVSMVGYMCFNLPQQIERQTAKIDRFLPLPLGVIFEKNVPPLLEKNTAYAVDFFSNKRENEAAFLTKNVA